MKEKKLKPQTCLNLSKKFIIIAISLFYFSLLSSLGSQILSASPSIQGIVSPLIQIICYTVLVVIFREHVEILLLHSIYTILTSIIPFLNSIRFFDVRMMSNIMAFISLAVEIAFITILILSLYKNLSPTITKAAILVRFAFAIVESVMFVISSLSYDISIGVMILNVLSSILFAAAFFIVFFFATREENKGSWVDLREVKLILIIVGIVLAIFILFKLINSDPTTTYYIDYNGNGKEDWGEAQFYEDKNGTHWLN